VVWYSSQSTDSLVYFWGSTDTWNCLQFLYTSGNSCVCSFNMMYYFGCAVQICLGDCFHGWQTGYDGPQHWPPPSSSDLQSPKFLNEDAHERCGIPTKGGGHKLDGCVTLSVLQGVYKVMTVEMCHIWL
jgi:hypothetical protein